jgi:malonyl-CoA O-methyltransferase
VSQVPQSESFPGLRETERMPPAHASRRVSASEGYALWAETYDWAPNPLLALEERVLDPLLPDPNDKDVVDVGCGTGRWLVKLARLGARSVTGIDSSETMLSQAARKCGLGRRLVQGDCLRLPLRDRQADLVICSFALGHISDLRSLAREFAAICRQAAHLFLTDLHPASFDHGWRCGFRHRGEAVEIVSQPHALPEIRCGFEPEGFELIEWREPALGEAERPLLARAGKDQIFAALSARPAILICHFKFSPLRHDAQ